MLNKKYRLKTNSSFKATYCQNRVVSDEFFVLFAGKNKQKEDDATRFGFVVSKKTDKRATVRNKIKRHMRESVLKYTKENKTPFMSVILKAKENPDMPDYSKTLTSVYNLLDKLAKKYILRS